MMSSISGRNGYPDHAVNCGTEYFVQGASERFREHLSAYDVRVPVLSPEVVETEVLFGVQDEMALASYNKKRVKMGDGISADIVADLIPNAQILPQRSLAQEICMTQTRRTH